MRTEPAPVVGYVATVLAVIAIASIAVFNLDGMTAKTHRSWDADIDRIIARQQEKKKQVELAALDRTAPASVASDAEARAAELTTGSIAEENLDNQYQTSPQKAQNQNAKRTGRRVASGGKHFIPAAFITLPKFAATTATSTLLRLR